MAVWKEESLTVDSVVLQDGIAMKHVDLVKDFKNKTILIKLIYDDHLVSIEKNQYTRICPGWISVVVIGSHYSGTR